MREIDTSKPLSKDDIAYLRARLPVSQVDRLVALAGTADAEAEAEAAQDDENAPLGGGDVGGAPEATEDPNGPENGAEGPEDGQDDDGEDDEDLIGDNTGDVGAGYNPLDHTVPEVKAYLDGASEDERARVKGVEQARTDREPRSSVLEYNPS